MTFARRLAARPARIFAGLMALGLLALIAALSLAAPGSVAAPSLSDKVQHFVAYFVLALPTLVAVTRARWPAALLVCICAGAGIELLQVSMALGREGSIADALANALGAGAGTAAMAAALGARVQR